MNIILRIMENDRITDYDLSAATEPVKIGQVSFRPEAGAWSCQADSPVEINGTKAYEEILSPGDIVLIDYEKRQAAYVMEKAEGESVYVEETEAVTVGRGRDSQIQLLDRFVSGRHCRFVKKAGAWYVEDLGSTNGTWVNDRLVRHQELHDGDVVKAGRICLRAGEKICVVSADEKVIFHVKTGDAVLPDQVELFSLKEQGSGWLIPSDVREAAADLSDRFCREGRWNGILSPELGPGAVVGVADGQPDGSLPGLVHDFRRDGNLAVRGGECFGGAEFLQTVAASLCFHYGPEQIRLYVLDMGPDRGQDGDKTDVCDLRVMGAFPHTVCVAGRGEPETAQRAVEQLTGELESRRELFARAGADSPGEYMKHTGKLLPSCFLVLTGPDRLETEFPRLYAAAADLGRYGPDYGIYLVCSFDGSQGLGGQIGRDMDTVAELRQKGSVRGRGSMRRKKESVTFQAAVPQVHGSPAERTRWLGEKGREMEDSCFRGNTEGKII